MNFDFILLLFFRECIEKFILYVCVHSGIQIQFVKNQLQMRRYGKKVFIDPSRGQL